MYNVGQTEFKSFVRFPLVDLLYNKYPSISPALLLEMERYVSLHVNTHHNLEILTARWQEIFEKLLVNPGKEYRFYE